MREKLSLGVRSRLKMLFPRYYPPENGYDPVPLKEVERYAGAIWRCYDSVDRQVGRLSEAVGGLNGKRVLDLAGGPGVWSIALAQRGAEVTWHDISRNYLRIVRQHAQDANVSLEYSLGYLEDAVKFVRNPFDIVVNEVSWTYCRNDRAFADLIYQLVRPGGAAWITIDRLHYLPSTIGDLLAYELNRTLAVKVGYPPPPPQRVVRLFMRHPLEYLETDFHTFEYERLFFVKPGVPSVYTSVGSIFNASQPPNERPGAAVGRFKGVA